MFTTKPTSAAKQPKASVPPPTSPKTKQMAATDDLFTASVDSGNTGGEPPQSSPDVLAEPAKPQKKNRPVLYQCLVVWTCLVEEG